MESSKKTSSRLLALFAEGNSQAASDIYSRYAARVVKLARTRLFDTLKSKVDPDDISQDTFQAFFELAARGEVRWNREGDLWRLLAGIAINQVHRQVEHFSAQKRRTNDVTISDPQLELAASAADEHVAAVELSDLVEHILEQQKPLMRKVLTARLAGFSVAEIALQNKRSERTIGRTLSRFKTSFAAMCPGHREIQRLASSLAEDVNANGFNGEIVPSPKLVSYHQFDLLRMLGSGEFAKVYLARNKHSGELMAVKVLKKIWNKDKRAIASFQNEINTLAQMDHPRIVRLLGSGTLPNGSPYLATEYVSGINLEEMLEMPKSPPALGAAAWRSDIAQALSALHAVGISHGDLTPGNIMVLESGRGKLIDFGFSTATDLGVRSDLELFDEIVGAVIKRNALCQNRDDS